MGASVPEDVVGSPRWWLRRLDDELTFRAADMNIYRQFVDGRHPLPESVETARKFRRIAGLVTTNLTGLAVEATAERIAVRGIRIGDDPDADKGVWDDIWQRSDFDAGSQEATTAALIYGRSFVSVGEPVGDAPARLHYEDPRNCIVAYDGDGNKLAAWKRFQNEWTGEVMGTLYLPTVVAKVRRVGVEGTGWGWELRTDFDSVVRNPFGQIPIFELQNRALGQVMSEVDPLLIPQQRLNQVIFNTDSVAEYGAFRQKHAAGIEVIRDSEGRPIAPFEAHIANMFVSSDPDAKFGDFAASELRPYLDLSADIAAHVARISRVPITYFLSNVSNLSADALALLVSGLVLKCQRRVKGYEPAFEGAVRLALQAMNDPRANAANIDVDWASMETRSVAQDADAAVKLTQGDNPVITPQTAQEKYLGMSQPDRDRDQAWREQNSAIGSLTALVDGLTPDVANV
jgi:hypothetical protein